MNSLGPLVSVVVPAYKMGAYIDEALQSVAAQTHRHWEVIVVDDHAPDDGTTAIVHAFAVEHPDQCVELIRHEQNKGVSAARNTAIAAAKGEFVAFLDPDDLWAPWHLERLLAKFAKEADRHVVTGPVVRFRKDAARAYRQELVLPDWKVRNFPHSLSVHNFIQPSATMVRRDALVGVGGFTTEPTLQHIEDYDLWIRLVEAGKRFAFLREPTSGYRRHTAAASVDLERMKALDLRLRERHKYFFQVGQSHMLWRMFDGIENAHTFRLGAWWDRLRNRIGGPKHDWIG